MWSQQVNTTMDASELDLYMKQRRGEQNKLVCIGELVNKHCKYNGMDRNVDKLGKKGLNRSYCTTRR
jgi:hypothetical protein